jgi:hypothetical protein
MISFGSGGFANVCPPIYESTRFRNIPAKKRNRFSQLCAHQYRLARYLSAPVLLRIKNVGFTVAEAFRF